MSAGPTPAFRKRYGPWALVAGASDGIGERFARRIAERGVNVVLLARREALLAKLAAEVSAEHGVLARPLVADLTAADLERRVEAATRGLEVGLLVYNAGAAHGAKPFHEGSVDEALRLVALDCAGPLLLAHRLGARMRERGRGGILLVGSMVSYAGSAYVATYSACKAFERILAEGLWHELRPHGVDVLAAIAGATRTPSLLASGASLASQPDAMEPDEVARGALDALGRGPVWIAGERNRALAKALSPAPRIPLVDAMSRATAAIYGLPHVPAAGGEEPGGRGDG
jgi:short-subunit dehydrogenase